MLMYTEEMETWIAEARQEEANNQARVRAAILREAAYGEGEEGRQRQDSVQVTNKGEAFFERAPFQVVDDGDGGSCTIHRNVLPDL